MLIILLMFLNVPFQILGEVIYW